MQSGADEPELTGVQALALRFAFFIVRLIAVLFIGCQPIPKATIEPGHTSRTINHPATGKVPFAWSEEILTSEKSAHDDLVAPDGSIVPGAPRDFEGVVILNGTALK